MAKKDEPKLNYNAEIQKLKHDGPQNLYFLWGPEDYLRELYVKQLKAVCLPEGEDSFSYKRIDGPELDCDTLQAAVDMMPFMTDRTLIELRGVDINRLKNPEKYIAVLEDIPEYCTVVFIQSAEYEPDGRLKFVKSLKASAAELYFSNQSTSNLIDWIVRRFAAAGKKVDLEAAQRLIFVSGDLMNRLIPEIEKVAAYTKGDRVTVSDVEAVAHHIPEAVIFEMTDRIADKQYNLAVGVMTELLADKDNEPIPMLAALGIQMRKLYAARLVANEPDAVRQVMSLCGVKYDALARKLIASARNFQIRQLENDVALCAESDYRMKNGEDPETVFKETVIRIIAEDMHG